LRECGGVPCNPAVTVQIVCDDVVPVLKPGGVEEGGDCRKRRVKDVLPPKSGGRYEDPLMMPGMFGGEVEGLHDELARPDVLGPVDQSLEFRRDPHRVDGGRDSEDVCG